MHRPEDHSYHEYYRKYTVLVPENSILDGLKNSYTNSIKIWNSLSNHDAHLRYAEGKWTLKEVLGHILDTEVIFNYRALRFSRFDPTPLAGYEQDPYVINGKFNDREWQQLIDDYSTLRQNTIRLYQNMSNEELDYEGIASGNKMTARATAYITIGHDIHHLNIVKERYLPLLNG